MGDLDHLYDETGKDYTVRIIGDVIWWGLNENNRNWGSVKRVLNLGKVGWENLDYAFYGATNLISFDSPHTDTSKVTSMNGLFAGASAL